MLRVADDDVPANGRDLSALPPSSRCGNGVLRSARSAWTGCFFLTRTASEWEARLGDAGVPCAAHRSTAEWLLSEHARTSGLVVPSESGDGAVQPGPIAWVLEAKATAGPLPAATPPASLPQSEPPPAEPIREPWLEGVRVLDLANVIAGPTIGATLARFGAQVDKLDPVAPTYSPDVTIVYGLAANRGKRSLLLDITDGAEGGGRSAFETLVARSDVLVANSTSASLERLRCAPADLEPINPELILCRRARPHTTPPPPVRELCATPRAHRSQV